MASGQFAGGQVHNPHSNGYPPRQPNFRDGNTTAPNAANGTGSTSNGNHAPPAHSHNAQQRPSAPHAPQPQQQAGMGQRVNSGGAPTARPSYMGAPQTNNHTTTTPQRIPPQAAPSFARGHHNNSTTGPQPSHSPAISRLQSTTTILNPHSANHHTDAHHPPHNMNNHNNNTPRRTDCPATVSFYPARVAEMVQETDAPVNAPTFNPHAESPSIRKTVGIDHSRSKPVKQDVVLGTLNPGSVGVVGGNAASTSSIVGPSRGAGAGGIAGGGVGDFTNPQLLATRKIGMPGSPSPIHHHHQNHHGMNNAGAGGGVGGVGGNMSSNRGAYRPPGPASGIGTGVGTGGGVKRGLDLGNA